MPPKKQTLTYSSEDVRNAQEDELRVLYCRYSGKPALITDASLRHTPRRKRDGAFVLDPSVCNLRLLAERQSYPTLVLRHDTNKLEKHFRFTIDKLPIAYKSPSPSSRLVYLLPDAITSHAASDNSVPDRPVPPCIRSEEGGCGIAVVLQDMQPAYRLRRIGADEITFAVRDPAEDVTVSLQQMIARILRVKQSAVHVYPGRSLQSRFVKVENLSPREAYERLSTEDLVANQRPAKRAKR